MLPWSFYGHLAWWKNNTQQVQPLKNTPWKKETPLQTIHVFGQIAIIPKPALRACWGKSLAKSPPFGVFPGCHNLPQKTVHVWAPYFKRCLCHVSVLDLSQFLIGRADGCTTKCSFEVMTHDYISLAGYFHHPYEKILPQKHRMETKTEGLCRVIFRWSIAVNFAECMLVKHFIPISSQKKNIRPVISRVITQQIGLWPQLPIYKAIYRGL